MRHWLASLTLCTIVLATIAQRAAAEWTPESLAAIRYKAVLVAGDYSATAFDHATAAMRKKLLDRQVPPKDIQRLSAAHRLTFRGEARAATLDHVLSAIREMRPGTGQGCLVFATSHGAYQQGLVLVPSENFLTPVALADALSAGCGDAPTVVIISGCFTGDFAKPPMARANRIILTAAREDRPSFGCGVGFDYTVYDRCLLQAMDQTPNWHAAYAMILTCVSAREKELRARPSEPQAWFGDAVREMPVPR